jgi:hypothetical protein
MVDDQKYDDDGDEPGAGGDPGDETGSGGEGDPDGLPGGRIPAPPIPRDEWVENVIDDPASNVQPVLLQGYVGDAAEEDYTRIYPNASLDSYVDVRNEDVLYHVPLEGEHAPRGGSMVWVRGDAQVSQGTTPAAGADFFTGPVLAQNRQAGAAGAAQPAAKMQITLLTIAGCPTRWFICPPQNTAATLCTHRIICSHVCQQPGGGLLGGNMTRMPCSAVDACPSALGCTSFQGCEPGPVVGPTGWQGCGQPTHMIGCTGWQGCGQPHISLPGCVRTGSCGTGPEAGLKAAAGPIGPTGWQGCGQPHISLPGCIQTGTCPQAQAGGAQGPIGQTGWQGCGQPTHLLGCTGATAVTVCICGPGPVSMHPGCPGEPGGAQGPIGQTGWLGCGQPGTIGPTGWLHCAHTLATVCTFHCLPPLTMGGICGPGPVQTVVAHCPSALDACPTRLCGGGGGEQVNPQAMMAGGAAGGGPIGPTGWQGCGQPHISLPGCIHTGTCPQAEAVTGPGSTIATVCTQIGCPHSGVANCSIATVCTQIGCHTAPQHCIPSLSGCPNTTSTICTAITCPVGVPPTDWWSCGHISLPGCVQTGSCGTQQQAGGAQGPIGQTGWLGCGQPHISLPGCIHTGTCPQAEAGGAQGPIGQTGWLGCQPTRLIGCTGYLGCGQPHISLPGCIQTGSCPQAEAGGAQGPIGQTGWLGCGQPGTIGPTGWLHCAHTLATVCTFHCPPPVTMGGICGPGPVQTVVAHCPSALDACPTRLCGGGGGEQVNPQAMMAGGPGGGGHGGPIGPTGWQGCGQPHISLPGCIYTGTCPPGGGAQEAVTGPDSTIATVCTQYGCRHTGYGCPRTRTCPPTFTPGCGPETEHGGSTAATLCTQAPFCPLTFQCLPVTMTPGCGPEQMAGPAGTAATLCTRYGCEHAGSTAATVCTRYGCGGEQMMAAAPQGAAGIPTGQYSPACPSFGFTCTYVHCPPNPGPGGTVATVCTQIGCGSTQLGCPRTISCPPTYTPGCGGAVGAAPQGAAGIPTGQYSPACPSFGFTCTQFC